MDNPLVQLVAAQKQGRAAGIYSVCSANRFVLEAAMLRAKADRSFLLIEATSNQVNQFGGYTGMTPEVFVAYVKGIAQKSMRCADDPGDERTPLPMAVAVARAAELCKVCEEIFAAKPSDVEASAYVIGTEVPPAGGATEKLDRVSPTQIQDAKQTIESTPRAFLSSDLKLEFFRCKIG